MMANRKKIWYDINPFINPQTYQQQTHQGLVDFSFKCFGRKFCCLFACLFDEKRATILETMLFLQVLFELISFLIIILLFIWKYVILSSSSSSLEISRLYSLFLFGYKGWIFVVVVVMSTRACIMRVNDVNNKVIMTLKKLWTKLNYWMTGFGFGERSN